MKGCIVRTAALAAVIAGCSALGSPSSTAVPIQEIIAGRPTAPAGIDDDFRPDPASVVAVTGRPQLIEFFAFW